MNRLIKRTAFLLAVGLLAGCGREEAPEQVELTFIHGWGGTVKTHATMQEIYREFEKRNPDIILKYQPSSDSSIAVEKANDMLAVDKMPDIVSTNGQSYYIQNAVKRGMALDLMPYIKEDAVFGGQIHPSVMESWTDGKRIYTLPDALEVMGYWYNKDYFEKAGITDVDGRVRIPATWDEFFEACHKLQMLNEYGGEQGFREPVSAYALENVQIIENLFLARLAGAGEEGLSMASGIPDSFDTDAFRRTVREFERIFSCSGEVDSLDDARQYFKEGKTAMYFNGIWEVEEFAECENAENIAFANYPTESGKSLSYISPSSGYILCNSRYEKKREAAVRFIKYILSEEVQLKLALETGQAPSNPNVDINTIIKEYPMLGNALESAHKADIQIKTISSVWNSRLMNTLKNGLRDASQSKEGLKRLIKNMEAER